MATTTKKRKSTGFKKRFIGKPTGQIQERVQAVGPEHFGIVAVDCAKRRSKWMLSNFYGKVVVEPTKVEHTAGGLRLMTQLVRETCREEGLTDSLVAVEMTGIYHKPVFRAFRKAGFDTRIVHPFASSHYRRPLHPDTKTDDHDLEAIFHAAVKGYGLATLPVGEVYQSLQATARHRHNLIKCHPHYRGLAALWSQQKVDPRDRRCRIANRAMRMVYQLVCGRQVWRGRGVDQEYLLAKLQQFHADHDTPMDQAIRDLNEAFAWLPKSVYAAEAKPLEELARKKRRGPERIGALLVPLLIRLGVATEEDPQHVESTTSEARRSH